MRRTNWLVGAGDGCGAIASEWRHDRYVITFDSAICILKEFCLSQTAPTVTKTTSGSCSPICNSTTSWLGLKQMNYHTQIYSYSWLNISASGEYGSLF